MQKTDDSPATTAQEHVCSTGELGGTLERCHAGRDGDCVHANCPQLRDGEPKATGRHCPLDVRDDDDSWLDDDAECERCHGDGRDPWNDYLPDALLIAAARRPLQADGCGACGDACASRGACRLAEESPEIEQRGTP